MKGQVDIAKCLKVLLLYVIVIFITVSGRPSNSTNVGLATNETRFIKGVRQGRIDGADENRLPDGIIKVLNYDIVLRPEFIDERTIITTGKVTISGTFLQKTDTITLHAGKNLKITDVSIEGVDVKVISSKTDESHEEFFIITLERTSVEEQGSEEFALIITYTTTFSGNVDGFDKNVYILDDKPIRLFSLTDLQPTMARKVFPCFDEPHLKATFKLTIYTPQGYGALSNTPLDKTESNSGTSETLKHVFQRTPPMSTHSLAFMVYQEDSYRSAPYGTVSMVSDSKVYSWAPKADVKSKRVDYSLTTGAELLGVLEDYLNSPFRDPNYNISIVNHVVIPDLQTRSSSKWGFLHSMLVDPRESTEADKDQAVKSLAKGLAQQWFGNLVTPSWWDDAWLTGGLAECLGYWVMDQVNDDWRAMERLVVEQQLSALEDDGWDTAPALEDTTEIAHKIGGLTDSKGSSIFMMLSKIPKIEETNLRNVLRKLIDSKKYDRINSDDLVSMITEELTLNVETLDFDHKSFLSSWKSNPGYPLISVTVNTKKKRAEVKQQRFTYNADEHTAAMSYYVPLHGRGDSEPTTLLLTKESDRFEDIDINNYFLLTNTGHYRVKYDNGNWEKLKEKLNNQMKGSTEPKYDITPVDRARLVDDSLNLARASILEYKEALPLVAYLWEETDYVPWVAAFRGLDFLERMLVNTETVNDDRSGPFKEFMTHILTAVYDKLGFTNSGSHLDKLLREQVLRAACSAGNEDCLDKAAAAFRSYIDQDIRPDTDLRRIVLCYGLKREEAKNNPPSQGSDDSGERDAVGEDVWTKLYNKLDKLTIDTERMAVISALGCSTDKENLNKYVRYIFQESFLKANEGPSVLKAVYKNPLGVDVVLEIFLQTETVEYISNTYGERTTVTILKDLANYIVTDDQKNKVNYWAVCSNEGNVSAEMKEVCDKMKEVADYNNNWFNSRLTEVNEALTDNAVSNNFTTTTTTTIAPIYTQLSTHTSSHTVPTTSTLPWTHTSTDKTVTVIPPQNHSRRSGTKLIMIVVVLLFFSLFLFLSFLFGIICFSRC